MRILIAVVLFASALVNAGAYLAHEARQALAAERAATVAAILEVTQ